MGYLGKMHRALKAERQRSAAYKLSRALQEFYASHLVSKWQRDRVNEIRALYEDKRKDLDIAHDHACSRLSEEFMEFELEYLKASDTFKEENEGAEMPFNVDGKTPFLTSIINKAKAFGLRLHGSKN